MDAFVCIALLIDYRLYRLIKSRLISVYFGLLVNMKKSCSQILWTLISTQAVVRTGPQESVSDIKENRLNNDGPIDPDDDSDARYTGSEAESEEWIHFMPYTPGQLSSKVISFKQVF